MEYDGRILSVIKPAGISSFGVVHKVKWGTGISRVGHAGTLDPFAEGVLIIGVGRTATRQLGDLMQGQKEYIADVVLGKTTTTGDLTGDVVSVSDLPQPSLNAIRTAAVGFTGKILQTPHAFSAVKVNGRRAYKIAREGGTPELEPRPITIDEIEVIEPTQDGFRMRVVCGHGTYIRKLAEDIGGSLVVGAYLSRLIRTRVGEFSIDKSIGLDDLLMEMRRLREG